MDIRMPDMDGIEATRQIITSPQTSAARVLILTTFDLDEYVFAALHAGRQRLPAQGHPAGRPAGRDPGHHGRRRAARPRRHPAADRGVHRHPEPQQRPAVAVDEITEREREVLTLVGLGLSNAEIAAHLHVSLSTAKTHVGRLLMKLGARDRAQLVIAAYNTGLVRPP